MQVNSLGLTEAQPENNVQRIVLEMLAVTLSKDARARAVQLPAWNEALGLPRPWDQQWSLRIQQVLAYESDLLEYGDLFNGSAVVEAKTAELLAGAEAEIATVLAMGGVIPAVESGYLKAQLVASHAARRARIESGEDKVVGRQLLRDHRAQPAHRRPGRRGPAGGPGLRAGRAGRPARRGARRRDETAVLRRPGPAQGRRGPDGRQPDDARPWPARGRA